MINPTLRHLFATAGPGAVIGVVPRRQRTGERIAVLGDVNSSSGNDFSGTTILVVARKRQEEGNVAAGMSDA